VADLSWLVAGLGGALGAAAAEVRTPVAAALWADRALAGSYER
jgi:hypothetical protein